MSEIRGSLQSSLVYICVNVLIGMYRSPPVYIPIKRSFKDKENDTKMSTYVLKNPADFLFRELRI